MKHSPLDDLEPALEGLEREGLLRIPSSPRVSEINFCSNDYLGLAARTMDLPWASGAGASRLVSGDHDVHRALEESLARWLALDSALLFTSGYAANVGALSALVQPGDTVLSDALNHASIIDGLRLSRARTQIVPHGDLSAWEAGLRSAGGRIWAVTESYFGMDADSPDLGALRALCDAAGAALYVDEAHALGVLGPGGRGLCAEAGIVPDVLVGTLGKALGAGGAFVSGRGALRRWLWNRARSFVFSTGLSPALAGRALLNLRDLQADDGVRLHVLQLATRLRRAMAALGCHVPGYGPVVPWVIGDSLRAVSVARSLCDSGLFVRAIRPPTVPAGTARLRLTVTGAHRPEHIEHLVDRIAELRISWEDSSSSPG